MTPRRHLATTLSLLTATAAPALADSVSLAPVKDNTLYQPSFGETNSNGAGSNLFVGATGGGLARRAVLAFDIAGSVPAGSTITSATLTLNVNKTSLGVEEFISLHRLSADWGEGTSSADLLQGGGQGAPATANDATWTQRFFPSTPWTTAGGDFDPTPSSTGSSSGIGPFTIPISAQFVADIQSFLTSPSTNFGWLLKGDESVGNTSLRIDSRESSNVATRPTLTINFSSAPPHLTGDTDNNGVVDLADLNNVLNNFGSSAPGNPGDENKDNIVDLADLNNVLNNFGAHAAASALAAIPEPTSLAACGLALLPLLRRRRPR